MALYLGASWFVWNRYGHIRAAGSHLDAHGVVGLFLWKTRHQPAQYHPRFLLGMRHISASLEGGLQVCLLFGTVPLFLLT